MRKKPLREADLPATREILKMAACLEAMPGYEYFERGRLRARARERAGARERENVGAPTWYPTMAYERAARDAPKYKGMGT